MRSSSVPISRTAARVRRSPAMGCWVAMTARQSASMAKRFLLTSMSPRMMRLAPSVSLDLRTATESTRARSAMLPRSRTSSCRRCSSLSNSALGMSPPARLGSGVSRDDRCQGAARRAPERSPSPLSWTLPKPAGDIVLCSRIPGRGEHLPRRAVLHHLTGAIRPHHHKGRVVRHAGGLLHVVGDDDDGIAHLQLAHQVLDAQRWPPGPAPKPARPSG